MSRLPCPVGLLLSFPHSVCLWVLRSRVGICYRFLVPGVPSPPTLSGLVLPSFLLVLLAWLVASVWALVTALIPAGLEFRPASRSLVVPRSLFSTWVLPVGPCWVFFLFAFPGAGPGPGGSLWFRFGSGFPGAGGRLCPGSGFPGPWLSSCGARSARGGASAWFLGLPAWVDFGFVSSPVD